MVIQRVTRFEIDGLIERLNARGTSRMLRDQPELCRDLLLASATIQAFILIADDMASLEIDVNTTPWRPR